MGVNAVRVYTTVHFAQSVRVVCYCNLHFPWLDHHGNTNWARFHIHGTYFSFGWGRGEETERPVSWWYAPSYAEWTGFIIYWWQHHQIQSNPAHCIETVASFFFFAFCFFAGEGNISGFPPSHPSLSSSGMKPCYTLWKLQFHTNFMDTESKKLVMISCVIARVYYRWGLEFSHTPLPPG